MLEKAFHQQSSQQQRTTNAAAQPVDLMHTPVVYQHAS